jgi:hypothetical protein
MCPDPRFGRKNSLSGKKALGSFWFQSITDFCSHYFVQANSEAGAGLTEAGGRQNLSAHQQQADRVAGDAAGRENRAAQAVAASVLSQVPSTVYELRNC